MAVKEKLAPVWGKTIFHSKESRTKANTWKLEEWKLCKISVMLQLQICISIFWSGVSFLWKKEACDSNRVFCLAQMFVLKTNATILRMFWNNSCVSLVSVLWPRTHGWMYILRVWSKLCISTAGSYGQWWYLWCCLDWDFHWFLFLLSICSWYCWCHKVKQDNAISGKFVATKGISDLTN